MNVFSHIFAQRLQTFQLERILVMRLIVITDYVENGVKMLKFAMEKCFATSVLFQVIR